ncbi:MAG: GNAT family N-acetyltransferase [Deltaproteobacteria bacterium]|nr:GNAT family N-acetyltransferase [Deltaproteobacteria bacterium]
MEKVQVRRAAEGDYPVIKGLAEKHNLIPNRYFTVHTPDCPKSILETEDQVIFVATRASIVIGFLNLHSEGALKANCRTAEFEVVVDPDHRINGAGSELLNEAIQYITSSSKAETLVAKIKNGNIGSERLCEKFGFAKSRQDSLGAFWELKIKR